MRTGVHNFFSNIDDFFSFINDMLQSKPDKAGNDLGRVMINTGFGLLGLIDIASDAGIPKGNEDFGQTFGVLGHSAGAVPVHSGVRADDGARRQPAGSSARMRARSATSPDVPTRNILWAHRLRRRARVGAAGRVARRPGGARPYTFIRRAYLQRREYLVHDGKPPPPKEDDE